MRDETKIRFWSHGPARLDEGLEERRVEMEDLQRRIAESSDDAERGRLQARLESVRAEYVPSMSAQERSLF